MAQKPKRKSGILAKRQRQARRLVRDRKIYRFLRHARVTSLNRHRMFNEAEEPLSVYAGKPGHRRGTDLTIFPLTNQRGGKLMPPWEDLTAWLKAQVLVIALDAWQLQTFSVQVHPILENRWLATGRKPGAEIRDRLRKEMAKLFGTRREHFYVIEGWSRRSKQEVALHVHGGGFIAEAGDGPKIMKAIVRACGHGIRGFPKVSRAIHGKVYWRDGPRYIDYLFKSVRRKDVRLEGRRLYMSREATGAGREMWGLMTEPR